MKKIGLLNTILVFSLTAMEPSSLQSNDKQFLNQLNNDIELSAHNYKIMLTTTFESLIQKAQQDPSTLFNNFIVEEGNSLSNASDNLEDLINQMIAVSDPIFNQKNDYAMPPDLYKKIQICKKKYKVFFDFFKKYKSCYNVTEKLNNSMQEAEEIVLSFDTYAAIQENGKITPIEEPH